MENLKDIQLIKYGLGKLAGLLLNDKIVLPFGKPQFLDFSVQRQIFKYQPTDGVFDVKIFEQLTDRYGFTGHIIIEDLECIRTQNYIHQRYDLNRLPWFILYHLFGGFMLLHNLRYSNGPTPDPADFERIFADKIDRNPLSLLDNPSSDWAHVRMYCGKYNIGLEKLKKFREDLYLALNKYCFFELVTSLAEECYKNEPFRYEGQDLIALQNNLLNSINLEASIDQMFQLLTTINKKFLLEIPSTNR